MASNTRLNFGLRVSLLKTVKL